MRAELERSASEHAEPERSASKHAEPESSASKRGKRERSTSNRERSGAERIRVAWSVPRRFLRDDDVRAAVRAALRHGGREHLEVDVALVSDAELASIHERFLDDPTPTDVISFDLGEDGDGPAAEVYASVDRAIEVARKRGSATSDELRLYVVHGTLHLCGFDDHEAVDRARMRRAESAVLRALEASTRSGSGSLERSKSSRGGTRDRIPHQKTGKRSER